MDGAYAGRLVAWARDKANVTLEVVWRMPWMKGLRRHPPSLGRGAHIRLDHEVPPPRAGLRAASGRCRNPHRHRGFRNNRQAIAVTLLKHTLR
ncbi:MAG: hypothetical protein ACJAVR_002598 [Paracoccaceae bacterium]|jgi:hypothetical protein